MDVLWANITVQRASLVVSYLTGRAVRCYDEYANEVSEEYVVGCSRLSIRRDGVIPELNIGRAYAAD
jgi:hypothetical protein